MRWLRRLAFRALAASALALSCAAPDPPVVTPPVEVFTPIRFVVRNYYARP